VVKATVTEMDMEMAMGAAGTGLRGTNGGIPNLVTSTGIPKRETNTGIPRLATNGGIPNPVINIGILKQETSGGIPKLVTNGGTRSHQDLGILGGILSLGIKAGTLAMDNGAAMETHGGTRTSQEIGEEMVSGRVFALSQLLLAVMAEPHWIIYHRTRNPIQAEFRTLNIQHGSSSPM